MASKTAVDDVKEKKEGATDKKKPKKNPKEQQTSKTLSYYEMIEPIPSSLGPISKFEATLENIPTYPSIVFFGKRRTGKSYGARDLCFRCFRHIPFGFFFFFFFFSFFLTERKQGSF